MSVQGQQHGPTIGAAKDAEAASVEPSAEHVPSPVNEVVEPVPFHSPIHTPVVSAHPPGAVSTPPTLDVAEAHRQTVANILQSLTGSTLSAVAETQIANRNRELVGQRVNNFEIIGLLGSGGMGDVFEAIHLVIHRKVAIKVLRPEHCADPALVQRFFNEARAANSIKHPNIVEILDVGMLPGGLPYIAMERLEGETLAQRLSREGKLDIERAVDFAAQSAAALAAAHKRGIVHRDLKPDNLFIVADPRVAGRELVKVLDFGIAKLHGDKLSQVKTNVGSILGTPPYMSPEQCRGIPDAVDHRSDVYALGVILFEMLCGAPPFVAEGVGDVMVMHLSSPPPLPRWRRQEIPLRIEQTILWAMEKNPDQRIPSMADFIFTLCSGPTPVPYIITPTGLTTSELPMGMEFAPSAAAPRYRAPAISLEGEFPTEEGAPISGIPAPARVSRIERRNSTPPSMNKDRDVRPSTRPSAPPQPVSRESWRSLSAWGSAASWRGVAVGAFGVAAAAAGVVALGDFGGPSASAGRSGRESQPPMLVSPVAAADERDLEVATAALHTHNEVITSPIDVVPPEPALPNVAQIASAAPTVEGAVPSVGATEAEPPVVAQRGPAPWLTRSAVAPRAVAPAAVKSRPVAAPSATPVSAAGAPGVTPPSPDVAAEPLRETVTQVTPSPAQPAPVVNADQPTDPGVNSEEAITGTLNFDCSPWARVSIAGRVLGVTPLRGVHLPAGTHQLHLENSELGTSTTVVVEIKPGQSVSRFFGWEQRP